MNRAQGDLCSADLEDGRGLEPNIRLELGVHPGVPMGQPVGCESRRKGGEGRVIKTRPELAHGSEDLCVLVVGSHEERAVGARPLAATGKRANNDKVDRVAEGRTILFLELDPLIAARPGVVRRVKGLRHEALAPGLKGFVEERFRLLGVVRDPDPRESDLLTLPEQGLEGLAALNVWTRCEIGVVSKEAVEREQGDGKFLGHPFDVRLPAATAADLLEREELARIRIDGYRLAFDDCLAALDGGCEAFDDVRELSGNVLEVAGEELDFPREDMRLHAQPVVLVLQGAPAESLENLAQRLEALREHGADRTKEFQVDRVESLKAFRGDHAGDLPEICGYVVRALHAVSHCI